MSLLLTLSPPKKFIFCTSGFDKKIQTNPTKSFFLSLNIFK